MPTGKYIPAELQKLTRPWSREEHFMETKPVIDLEEYRAMWQKFWKPPMVDASDRFLKPVEDIPLSEVPVRIWYPPVYHRDNEAMEKNEIADWCGVHPDVQRFASVFIAKAKKMGIPLFVSQARLTPAQEKYKDVRGKSPFTTGHAIKVSHLKLGSTLTENEWRYIGILGMQIAERLKIPMLWAGRFPGQRYPEMWHRRGWIHYPVIPEGAPKLTKTPAKMLKEYAYV